LSSRVDRLKVWGKIDKLAGKAKLEAGELPERGSRGLPVNFPLLAPLLRGLREKY